AVSSDGKQTFFMVRNSLTNTKITDEPAALGGFEVTVWDATKWSRENAMGEVTSGAHVTIYRSQKDYFDGKVLFEGESDAEGKVRFNEVESGVYYIVATKG